MTEEIPTIKTPESLFREARVLFRKLYEHMPEADLPEEPWFIDETGKPILCELFRDIDFLVAIDADPVAGPLFADLYKLFKEAEKLPRESIPNDSERLRMEVSEFLKVYDDETLHHLTLATTWELAKDDERRTSLRNNTFQPLQTKMVELVQTQEIRDPESRTNPKYDWFWKDVLPRFLQARAAHGRYINDILTHDMPNWTPLIDYCKVASNEL